MTTFVFMFSIISGRYFDSHGARTLLIMGSLIFTGAQIGIACESLLPAILHSSLLDDHGNRPALFGQL